MITELTQDWGNRLLKSTKKTLCAPGPRRKEQLRESVPRQVDKKSRIPKEEEEEEEKAVWGSQRGDRGLEFSRRRKAQMPLFLSLHSLVLVT